jgi:hypothetical protein
MRRETNIGQRHRLQLSGPEGIGADERKKRGNQHHEQSRSKRSLPLWQRPKIQTLLPAERAGGGIRVEGEGAGVGSGGQEAPGRRKTC